MTVREQKMFGSLDVETSMKPVMFPYQEGAFLCTVGLSLENGEHFDWVFNHSEVSEVDTAKNVREIRQVLSRVSLLFGHNIKFDLLWMLALKFNLWKDIPPIWDTMVVHYLQCGQRPIRKDLSLAELSVFHGIPEKKDKVKMYWESGINTDKIPLRVLLPYQKQDCFNALSIGKKQHAQMIEDGYSRHLIKLQNEVVKELASYENAGWAVSKERMEEYIKEYDAKLNYIYYKLGDIAHHYDPVGAVHLDFNKPVHISTFLYGGNVTIDVDDVVVYTKKHILKEVKKDDQGQPLSYKSGQKKGQPVYQNKVVDLICTRTRKGKQEIPFKGCGFKPPKFAVNDDTGNVSSDKNVLPVLKKGASNKQKKIITWLEERSNVKKVLETFKGKDGEKGLINKIQIDSLIHPKYNQTIAKTGRLSSSDPNGQNFPRSGTSPLKKIFISRYGNDGYILVADLAQLEWRVAAFLSQDKVAIKEIVDLIDYHGVNATTLFGDIKFRQDAKILGFRLLYGGSAYAFFMDSKMPKKTLPEWDDIVKKYYAKYHSLDKWQNELFAFVNNHVEKEKVLTADGSIATVTWGWYISPTGRKYRFRKQPIKKLRWAEGFKDTQVKNFPVQGTATGDVMPLAMCVIGRRLRQAQDEGRLLSVVPFGQVHDSMLFDCKKEDVRELSDLCIQAYEDLPQLIETFFGFHWNVPLTGDATVGSDYGTTQFKAKRKDIGHKTIIEKVEPKPAKLEAYDVDWIKAPNGEWIGNVYTEKELEKQNAVA